MKDRNPHHHGHGDCEHEDDDCNPRPPHCAEQPKPPGCDCPPLEWECPPKLCEPGDYEPDPCCDCPTPPPKTSECLEKLIEKQDGPIAAADKAKKFKENLERVLLKAKEASKAYTRKYYEELVERWVGYDKTIASYIETITCRVKCWRCIVECYICPPIYDIHRDEGLLYDGGREIQVRDLQDLRYWHQRDRERKQRTYDRINAVVQAWESPAAALKAALDNEKSLIQTVNGLLGTDPPRAIPDLFLKLIPLHLAVAPPEGSCWKTRIAAEYTEFCKCEPADPDTCCGPILGPLSVRQRLIGKPPYFALPPYLIEPKDFFRVICCLVENRLGPAHAALLDAHVAFDAVDARIKRLTDSVPDRIKSFDGKAPIPGDVECCDRAVKQPPAAE